MKAVIQISQISFLALYNGLAVVLISIQLRCSWLAQRGCQFSTWSRGRVTPCKICAWENYEL